MSRFRAACLEYGQYGELLQLEMSVDGSHLALLVKTRNERCVYIINLRQNKLVETLRHADCSSFVVSPNWQYVCTVGEYVCDSQQNISELRLWRLNEIGASEYGIEHASAPQFSRDSRHLLYVNRNSNVQVFDVDRQRHLGVLPGHADRIHVIPNKPDYVMTSLLPRVEPADANALHNPADNRYRSLEDEANAKAQEVTPTFATSVVWRLSERRRVSLMNNVGPSSMRDFSKDGRYCIDGFLQVFEVDTGRLVRDLNPHPSDVTEHSLVRLTFDGLLAIWADTERCSLTVARISDGKQIGYCSTHEKPTSLELFDFGLVAAVGREDGNILTIKVEMGSGFVQGDVQLSTVRERAAALLKSNITEGLLRTFDAEFATAVTPVSDLNLPKVGKDVQSRLLNTAKVPHAVFNTSNSSVDLKELERMHEKNSRRLSSPPHTVHGARLDTSPSASPSTMPRNMKPLRKENGSRKTLPKVTSMLQVVASQMMAVPSSRGSTDELQGSDSSANSSPFNSLGRRKKTSVSNGLDDGKKVGQSQFFHAAGDDQDDVNGQNDAHKHSNGVTTKL